jgi:hypothetical protein
MQGAVEAVMDFSGTSAQTVVFTEDPTVLRRNIEVTEAFLESLGSGELSHTENSVIWRNIPFEVIKNGLLVGKYEFHERASVFNHIEAFCQWYEESAPEANYTGWNIVAAGTKVSSEEKMWVIPGGRVGKINRSRLDKKTHDGSLSIGVLRAPRDLYEDLQPGILTDEELNSLSKSANSEAVRKARERAGFELTPLLLIYRIDKDSKAPEKAENEKTPPRKDLNVQEDIIGLAMWIPGVKAKQLVKKVTVKITHEDMDRDDETGDSGED